VREVENLEQLPEAPPPGATRWLNVECLDVATVTGIARAFGLHPLAAEDVLHTPQRPKFEAFGDTFFLVCRMLRTSEGHLLDEQVSLFVRDGLVITFQQIEGDVWSRIRTRLGQEGSAFRTRGSGYLVYALIDAIVDHCFPVLEHYGDQLAALEEELLDDPSQEIARRIHGIKRELLILRRVLWPMRDMIDGLRKEELPWLTGDASAYIRDVHDHIVRVIDLLETFREMSNSLNDLYVSQQSHKMNEVMKMLTVMSSIFIPITFLAGVWGMNFQVMPELGFGHGYAAAWGSFIAIGVSLLAYFRRRGWL
jgi:magnesium transporter